ncbi:MAG: response regulator [Candidatus Nanoarchaeia archaeon]
MEKENVSVLVVDDSEFMRDLIRKALEKAGCTNIQFAGSGKETMEILHNHNIDILFLDISIPEGNGLTTFSEISDKYYKNQKKKPRCIVVSATDQPAIRDDFAKLGAIGYIKKPFKEEEVIQNFEKALASFKLSKEE